MAITIDDFSKIWASTSPLTPYSFSEDNYKQGWNFVGATPPSRQMWDFLQKNNDEKMQYLANNYLPLSGGTMTGDISLNGTVIKSQNDNSYIRFFGGSSSSTGSDLTLWGMSNGTNPGTFRLKANNGTDSVTFVGNSNGTLTWNGKEVERVNASGTNYIRYESGLQICWNRVAYVTTAGVTETFPMPFTSSPRITTGCISNAVALAFGGLSATGCTFKAESGTQAIDYIALGYWK